MTDPASPSPQAGGFIIAAGLLVGAVVGAIAGQPTMGVLGGFAIGVAVAVVIWLRDRRAS